MCVCVCDINLKQGENRKLPVHVSNNGPNLPTKSLFFLSYLLVLKPGCYMFCQEPKEGYFSIGQTI